MGSPNADRLWQLTVEHSPVGMALVGLGGELLMVNRALCGMLGHPEADLAASTWHGIAHPDDLEDDADLFLQAVTGRQTTFRVTKRFVRADGSEMWGDLSVALMLDDDGAPRHFISQIIDVTAQRLDQAELREALELVEHQRRQARAILDTVVVGLLLLDRHGHYEVMNRRHQDFLDLAFPEGHRAQAGQLGDVYAADGVSEVGRDDMPSVRAVRGEEFDDHRIWIGAAPETRRALSVSARTVRDPDGAITGAAMAYSDVTELMQAVRSREEFLASVSHELRTPLTSVLGHLEMLLEDDVLDAPTTVASTSCTATPSVCDTSSRTCSSRPNSDTACTSRPRTATSPPSCSTPSRQPARPPRPRASSWRPTCRRRRRRGSTPTGCARSSTTWSPTRSSTPTGAAPCR